MRCFVCVYMHVRAGVHRVCKHGNGALACLDVDAWVRCVVLILGGVNILSAADADLA